MQHRHQWLPVPVSDLWGRAFTYIFRCATCQEVGYGAE